VPRLECLEDRLAPATTITWTGGGDHATWDQAANWNLLRTPTNGDDVVIPSTNVNGTTLITLSGVNPTIASLTSALPIADQGFILTTTGGGMVLTGGVTLTNNAALTLTAGANLDLSISDQMIGGDASGAIVFGDANASNAINVPGGIQATVSFGMTVTGQSGQLSGGGSFLNNGTIEANVAGGTISVNAATTNSAGGVLEALNGGVIALNVAVTGGGTITTDTGNNSQVTQNGVTITGNTISGVLVPNTSGGNRLASVAITSTGLLDMTGNAEERVTGGLILDGTINIHGGGFLGFGVTANEMMIVDSSGPSHTGHIVFGDSNENNRVSLDNGVTLTVGAHLVVRGEGGHFGAAIYTNPTGSLTNLGTIQADIAGGILHLEAATANNATIQALNGDTLQMDSIAVTGNGLITTDAVPGSRVVQNGTGIAGNTISGELVPTNNSSNLLTSVTITSSAVVDIISSEERFSGSMTALDGTINIKNFSYLGFGVSNGENIALTGSGTITFDNNPNNTLSLDNNVALTLGANITVRGENGIVGPARFVNPTGTLINNGKLQADVNGGTLHLAAGTTNNGTIAADNGGRLSIEAAVSGNGTITTDTGNSSTVSQSGITITGNTISGELVATNNVNNVLTGATITSAGTVDIIGGIERISGGLTLDGTINVSAFSYIGFGVAANETESVDSSGSSHIGHIVLDSNAGNAVSLDNNVTLTVGSHVIIQGENGTIGVAHITTPTGSLINNGTIAADTGNGTLTVNPASFTVGATGAVNTAAGCTVNLTTTFTNFSGVTLTGGTYTEAGTFEFGGANIVTNNGAAITLDGPGSLITPDGSTDALAGLANNTASGTFTIQNGRNFSTATAFTNAGSVSIGAGSTFTVTAGGSNTGSFAVAATGALSFTAGTYLLDNGSSITGAGFTNIAGATVNTGVVAGDVVNATNVTFSSGTLGGPGTLDIANTFNWQGGNMTSTGTVVIGAGAAASITGIPTYDMGGHNIVNDALATSLTAATLNGTGTLTNAGTLTLTDGIINTPFANHGLLIVQGASAVNSAAGDFTTNGSSTIRIQGNNTPGAGNNSGDGLLNVANGFINNGAIELTTVGPDVTRSATLNVTSGSLTNAGTISSLVGIGFNGFSGRTLGVELLNQGTVNVAMPMILGRASAHDTNSGSINLAGGDLTLNQSGTAPSFTNTGAISVGSGRTFAVSGGVLNQDAGSLGGGGKLMLTGVTGNFTTDYSTANLDLALTASTFNGPGTLTNASGHTVPITDSTIAASFDNEGLLTVQGASAITSAAGAFTTAATSTLRVQGNNTPGSGTNAGDGLLTVANGFTNNGAVELTTVGPDATRSATLNVTSGSLTNAGSISSLVGVGFNGFSGRTLGAQLINQGTVTVSMPMTLASANAAHVNSGTGIINVTGGSLTVTQSGALPSFSNNGTISVGAGETFAVNGGTFSNAGSVTATGAGSLVTVSSPYIQTAGSTTLGGGSLTSGAGIVTIQAGTFTGTGTVNGNLEIAAAAMLAPGTNLDAGTITVNGNLLLDPGATLVEKLNGASNPDGFDQVAATGTVTITGAILTGGRLVSYVPPVDTPFRIIDNQSGSATIGTFAQGTSITFSNIPFNISYSGGTGNDVTLTAPAPTAIYVDDSWAGTSIGTDPANNPFGSLVFGYNAFSDLQSGVSEAAVGATITVFGGTYSGAVDITKTLQPIQLAQNADTPGQSVVTISGPMSLSASTTLVMVSTDLMLGGTVNDDSTGSHSLTITGNGTVTIAGVVGGSKALAALVDQGSTTQLDTSAITTTGGQSYTGAVTLGSTISLTSTNSGDINFSSTIDGAFGLTIDTGGTTTFGGMVGALTPLTSLITDGPGATALNGSSVNTSGAQRYHDAVTLGGAAALSAASVLMDGATISLGANTLTVANTDVASTVSSQITGAGALVKSGAGTLTLTNAANSYGGFTTVSGGTLSISADADLGSLPFAATANDVTLQNGAALQLANGLPVVTLNANRGITLGAGGGTIDTENEVLNIDGSITGLTGLTKTGGGDLVLEPTAGSNTPGTVTVSGGRLFFVSQDALGGGAVGVGNGATLDYSGLGALALSNAATFSSGADIATRNGTLTLPVATVFPTSGMMIFNSDDQPTTAIVVQANDALSGSFTVQVGGQNANVGTIDWTGHLGGSTGASALVKSGSGALILDNVNGYKAGTTITGGTLVVAADNELGNASSNVTVGAGTLEVTAGFTTARTFTLSDPAATIQVDPFQTLALSAAMGGSGSLNKTGAGTLDLTGLTNTFGGLGQTVAINAGTLGISSDAGLGNAANQVAFNGGSLQATGAIASSRNATLNSSATIDTNGNNVTLAAPGSISGAGGLTKVGTGTLTLSGNNTYSGSTTISAGTVSVSADANLGQASASINVGAATLEASATFTSGHSITLTDPASTITVDAGQVLQLSNPISGAGGLTKAGGGTLILTGANSYTGATTINAGTLILNGSLASSATTTVNTGATLAGNGSLGGPVLNSGGTVSPGTGTTIGTLAITGGYTQSASGTLVLKLAGNATPGVDYDTVTGTGFASLSGTIHVTTINGFTPAGGDSYHVLSSTGGGAGNFTTQIGFVYGNVFLVEAPAFNSLNLNAVANPIVVTNGTDSHVNGELSLREAVNIANAASRLGIAPTVTFALNTLPFPGSITLTQGAIEIGRGGVGAGAITIDGTDQMITINANSSSQAFVIDAGASASLAHLTLLNGSGQFGGAIENHGTLTLSQDSLNSNTAQSAGGGLWSDGTLNVTGSIFRVNIVNGGNGDGGGAIAVAGGTATIASSDFFDNHIIAFPVGAANVAGGAVVALVPTTLQFNRFNGNADFFAPTHGNAVAAIAPATVNVDDSWWSNNAGPAANDVVRASGGIFTEQGAGAWLQLTSAASPSLVAPSQTSTVTAGFTTDSLGHAVAPANLGAMIGNSIDFGGNTLQGSSLTGAQTSIQNDGVASVTYNPGTGGGLDNVSATVDGVTVSAAITVKQAPQFISATSAPFVVAPNQTFNVQAAGFPLPTITMTAGSLPTGVTFQGGTATGFAIVSGTPAPSIGAYTVTFTADNGVGTPVTQTFTLIVTDPPTITIGNATTFAVNAQQTLNISFTPGIPTTTTVSASKLPAGLVFTPGANGTATISGKPASGTGGAYPVTITAKSGMFTATQTFTLNVNQPLSFTSAATTTLAAGQSRTFTIKTAGFPFPQITPATALPTGVTLTDNHNGTATLSVSATAATGTDTLSFLAHNGINPDATQNNVRLTVVKAPSFTGPTAITFTANQVVPITMIAASPGVPNTTPTITKTGASALPPGVTFSVSNGSVTFTGKPTAGGTYPVTFTASNGVSQSTEVVTFTVDQPPSITSGASAKLVVGQPAVTFTVKTGGFPGATIASPDLPAGVTLTPGPTPGTAILTATATAATGTSSVTFTAHNGFGADATQRNFKLTIVKAPSFTGGTSVTFTANTTGTPLTFGTSLGVPNNVPTITKTGTLPTGVTFSVKNGSVTISGKPAVGTGGSYPVTFTASNGVAKTSETVTVIVDQAPKIVSAASAGFVVGQSSTFTIKTTGFPFPTITTASMLPAGVALVPGSNGTAMLVGIPGSGAGGTYNVTLVAHNGIGADFNQTLTLTVKQSPVFTNVTFSGPGTIGATFTRGQMNSVTFTTNAPTAKLTLAGTPPSGITFTPGPNGTATLSGIARTTVRPGSYLLLVTANDGTNPPALQLFTLVIT
jgi:autotransporter-associated beta strand protein